MKRIRRYPPVLDLFDYAGIPLPKKRKRHPDFPPKYPFNRPIPWK